MKKVITLDDNEFSQISHRLASEAENDFGTWSVVVGIATGGLYVADAFSERGGERVDILKQRSTTSVKKKLPRWVLALMPRVVADLLRLLESWVYGIADRFRGVNLSAFSLPLEATRKIIMIRSRLEVEDPLVIIVDDASDSGDTLRQVRDALRRLWPEARIKTAVIAATRESGSQAADLALYRKNALVRFPWAADNNKHNSKWTGLKQ